MSITNFPDLQTITAANLKPSYPADTFLFVENADGTHSTYFTDKTGVPRECGRSLEKVIQQINVLNTKDNGVCSTDVLTWAKSNPNRIAIYAGSDETSPLSTAWGTVGNKVDNSNFITLYMIGNMANILYYRRIFEASSYDSGWQQIATTEKTPFSCTARAEYTIISQYCYIINNDFIATVQIQKNDGTVFSNVSDLIVADLPFVGAGLFVGGAMGTNDGATWNLTANCYISSSSLTVSTSQTTVKKITLTVKGVK